MSALPRPPNFAAARKLQIHGWPRKGNHCPFSSPIQHLIQLFHGEMIQNVIYGMGLWDKKSKYEAWWVERRKEVMVAVLVRGGVILIRWIWTIIVSRALKVCFFCWCSCCFGEFWGWRRRQFFVISLMAVRFLPRLCVLCWLVLVKKGFL